MLVIALMLGDEDVWTVGLGLQDHFLDYTGPLSSPVILQARKHLTTQLDGWQELRRYPGGWGGHCRQKSWHGFQGVEGPDPHAASSVQRG